MQNDVHTLDQISFEDQKRITSQCSEWDRVAGGGIVPGSFFLVSGDPGIGKSTLLLQICTQLGQEHSIIYFSSEESLSQVKLRFVRIAKTTPDNLLFSDQSSLESILEICKQKKPDLLSSIPSKTLSMMYQCIAWHHYTT